MPPFPVGKIPVVSEESVMAETLESAVPDDFTKPEAGSDVVPVPP